MPEMSPGFHVGGYVRPGALYVAREADRVLLREMLAGRSCYVLAPRQSGKSSLRHRTALALKADDARFRCASIDLNGIGTQVTPEQWYFSLLERVAESFDLPDDIEAWWESRRRLSLAARLEAFFRDLALPAVQGRCAVFLDEIDTLLSLPEVADDFFRALRALTESNPPLAVVFCLLGVALPGDLVRDHKHTPINNFRVIALEDFSRDEAHAALLPGFGAAADAPEAVLDAIMERTDGHPYMTLRIAQEFVTDATAKGDVAERVERIARRCFIEVAREREALLQYIDEQFSPERKNPRVPGMLEHYASLLHGRDVKADQDDEVQAALILTGLVRRARDGGEARLVVRNRILATIFDRRWVDRRVADRRLAQEVLRWEESGRADEALLSGAMLEEARNWANEQNDVTVVERLFLRRSLERELDKQDALRRQTEALREAERAMRKVRLRNAAIAVLGLVIVAMLAAYVTITRQLSRIREQDAEIRNRSQVVERTEREARVRRMEASASLAGLLATQPGRAREAVVEALGVLRDRDFDAARGNDLIAGGLISAQAARASLLSRSVRDAGDGGAVNALEFSADGRWAVAVHQRGVVGFWDLQGDQAGYAASFTARPASNAPPSSLSPSAISLDVSVDETAAVGWGDGIVRFYRRRGDTWVADGELAAHDNAVTAVHRTPDGSRLVTGSKTGALKVWERREGRWTAVATFPAAHDGSVFSARFVHGGRALLTAGGDGVVRVWEQTAGRWGNTDQRVVTGGRALRVELVAERGDDVLITTDEHTVLYRWTPEDRAARWSMRLFLTWAALELLDHAPPRRESGEVKPDTPRANNVCVRVSLDGNTIVAAEANGRVRVWNRDGARWNRVVDRVLNLGALTVAALHRDARWLLAGDGGGAVHRVELLASTAFLDVRVRDWLARAQTAPGGRALLLENPAGNSHLWVFTGGGWRVAWSGVGRLSGDGRTLAARSPVGRVSISTLSPSGVLSEPVVIPNPQRWSSWAQPSLSFDGARVASITADGVSLHDNQGAAIPGAPLRVGEPVERVRFSDDGQRLIALGARGSVLIWRSADGALVRRVPVPAQTVADVWLSPRGDRLLARTGVDRVEVWTDASDAALATHEAPDGAEPSFSATRFAMPDGHGAACVYALATGAPLRCVGGAQAGISRARFSADGGRLVTAGGGAVQVWEVETGRALSKVDGGAAVTDAAFVLGDRAVAATGSDGTLRVLAVDIDLVRDILCDGVRQSNGAAFTRDDRGWCEQHARPLE